jgi:hypothetical protein
VAQLKLSRIAAGRDRLRKYRILVDGKSVGKIADDSDWSTDLDPGRHTLQLKIDWKCSPRLEVEVARDAVTRLECGPTGGPIDGLAQIFQRSDRYLYLRELID